MDKITTRSTSRDTAEVSDIKIKETDRIRLVFRPLLVDNHDNVEASLKGAFLYQKKGAKDEWIDFERISLGSLKKGEGYKLELHSAELLDFYEQLSKLYALHELEGVPRGERQYVEVGEKISAISDLSTEEITEALDARENIGNDLLVKLLKWAATAKNSGSLIKSFSTFSAEEIKQLNASTNLQNLKNMLRIWEDHSGNDNEEFWQQQLTENSFLLEQVFTWPMSLVASKAYVGGKCVSNKGGGLVDFLVKNAITKNAALIEIKTPNTLLLGGKYRNGIYNVSSDVSGSVMQVLNYKDSLAKEYASVIGDGPDFFNAFEPSCIVIMGNFREQLGADKEKIKSFELFRRKISGVEIITYDELFSKTRQLIEVLSNE